MLQEQLDTENLVSERIRKFVQIKTETLTKKADQQDRTKDKRIDLLQKDIEEIEQTRQGDGEEIVKMQGLIEEEIKEKDQRNHEEKERQEELERKIHEKIDMEDAARYIQRKWKWYQEVGKFLAKKKKKGKKGKKKK